MKQALMSSACSIAMLLASATGEVTVQVRAPTKPGLGVMNLRTVLLKPAGA